MASKTIAGERAVVGGGTGYPGRSGMTGVAFLCRHDMVGRLAGSNHIIMTT